MPAPPSISGNINTGTPDTAKPARSADDVLDLFNDESGDDKGDKDDEEPIRKPRQEKKESSDKESDDEDDKEEKPRRRRSEQSEDDDEGEDGEGDEIDLKGAEDLEDEEEIKIETPPKKKEVLEKYPKLFKEFPWFEKMMFRDRQFMELFGSFEDAKDIKADAAVLQQFEADMMKGDSTSVLKQIKENSPETFDKIVDNYLPNLYKVDQEAYYHIVGNVTKQIIKELNNGGMKEVAKGLTKFMFGKEDDPGDITSRSKEKPQNDEIKKEKEDFYKERFEVARNDLQGRVDNVLKSTINEYIDPKNEMSAFVKKNAVREALAAIHEALNGDKDFMRSLNRLWENSAKERFSQNSLNSIRSAYLGKAKGQLNGIIRNVRREALKDAAPAKRDKDEEENDERPRKRTSSSNSGSPRRRSGNDNDKRQRGESVLDFLSRD